MSWTIERFQSELEVLFASNHCFINKLKKTTRDSISAFAVAAFELRGRVSSCKAWRHKSVEQIDEDFMMTVVIPLIKQNPRISDGGDLLPWNNDYKDRRGPKPLSPTGEQEVSLLYLQKRISELSRLLEKCEAAGMSADMPDTGSGIVMAEMNSILDAYKTVMKYESGLSMFKEIHRSTPIAKVYYAMQYLTSVGIPCSKIDIDAFWLDLMATAWGVEPNNIYSIARKVRKYESENPLY